MIDSFICDALCDLVLFVQFKKHENSPWRSDTFTNVAGFSCFLFNSSEIKPGPKIERSFYGVQANLKKSYFGAKITTGIYLLVQSQQ